MARTQQFSNNDAGLAIRNMLNAFLDWKSTYSYNINDCAIYNGMIFKSLTNANLNNAPAVGAYWDLFQYQLGDLSNVALSAPATDEVLKFDGVNWVNGTTESGVGTNTFLNPGFETTPGSGSYVFLNWINQAQSAINGYVEASTTNYHSGVYGAKMTKGTSANWYAPQLYQVLAVTEAKRYRLTFWTKGDGTNAGKYALQNVNTSGYIVGPVTTGITTNTWTKVSYFFTAPAGCTQVRLYLACSAVEGSIAYYDDAALQEILSGTSSTLPRVILPNEVTAVVGKELQLFIRGMIEAEDPYSLPYEISCSKGDDMRRYFSYTPEAGDVAGSPYTLTVNILDNGGEVIATDECDINVVAETAEPASNINVMTMGDSLTAGGQWTTEMYRMLTQSGGTPAGLSYGNITFCGDKAMSGYSGAAYTGWSGWAWDNYLGTTTPTDGHILTGTFDKDKSDVNSIWSDGTNQWKIIYAEGALKIGPSGTYGISLAASGTLTHVSGATHTSSIVYSAKTDEPVSPLWDAAKSGGAGISFDAWATRNSYADIDVLYVLLGWNGMTGANLSDAEDWDTTDMEGVLDQFHADYPSAKVKLVGINCPSPNGGLGRSYGATGTYSNYYKLLRNVMGLNLAYQAYATTNSTWVEFINISAQLDSEYNLPNTTNTVNTRSVVTETIGTNGIHPDTEGYYQIADAAYRNFIKEYCS